jgi:ADP-ribose pyrophosphatase YjhB (NUDIX family)
MPPPTPASYLDTLRARLGHELIPLSYSTAIVRDEEGRILFHHRSDFDVWGLPGGILEPGETAAGCAVRETREETGLEVRPLRLAAVLSAPEHTVSYPNGDQAQQISPYFECKVMGGKLRSQDRETTDLAFYAPGSLPKMFPWYQLAIRHALASSSVYFDPPISAPPGAFPNPIWRHIRSHFGPDPLVLPGATALIRNERGSILMLRRIDTGKWWLPGGLLELGESLASTAIREVKEETGLDVEPVRVAGIFAGHKAQFPGPDQLFPLATWFDCRVRGGTITPDHEEADAVEFFPAERLPETPAGLEKRIQMVLDAPDRAVFV